MTKKNSSKMVAAGSVQKPVKQRTYYSNAFKLQVIADAQDCPPFPNDSEIARWYNLDRRLVNKWRIKYERLWTDISESFMEEENFWDYVKEEHIKQKDRVYKVITSYIEKALRLEDEIHELKNK